MSDDISAGRPAGDNGSSPAGCDEPLRGLVQVYTGGGKGKTTAAIGLAMRAAGRGLRVLIVQFLKGRDTGELHSLERMAPAIRIVQVGTAEFAYPDGASPQRLEMTRRGLRLARRAVRGDDYDLVVLDEALVAADLGFIEVGDLLALIHEKAPNVELVLTGRGAPEAVVAAADLVTRMEEVKHPYRRGVEARCGVDY